MQTSTVTVAVFVEPAPAQWTLRENDIETFFTKSTGAGGQHKNRTLSCVVMRHKPTGIEATGDMRSQHRSKEVARAMLEARVKAHHEARHLAGVNANRHAMVGSGMRGDKVRTYRTRDDQVTDHRSERKVRLRALEQWSLEELRGLSA